MRTYLVEYEVALPTGLTVLVETVAAVSAVAASSAVVRSYRGAFVFVHSVEEAS